MLVFIDTASLTYDAENRMYTGDLPDITPAITKSMAFDGLTLRSAKTGTLERFMCESNIFHQNAGDHVMIFKSTTLDPVVRLILYSVHL